MKCTLVGQTVKFLEYGKTKNENLIANFIVADIEEEKTFYFCKAYGATAEFLKKYFDVKEGGKIKSRKIVVFGKQRHYQGKTKSNGSLFLEDVVGVLKSVSPSSVVNLSEKEKKYSIDVNLENVEDKYYLDVDSVTAVDSIQGIENKPSFTLNKEVKKEESKNIFQTTDALANYINNTAVV